MSTPRATGGSEAKAGFADDESRWRAWMARAQDGDREAYRRLLEEISVAIRAYLGRTLGDTPLLDDCVQESLIGIHRARHSFDPDRRFRPWMFAIVRHKAVDAMRRGSARAHREAPESEAPPESSHGPDELRNQTIDARRILDGLDPPFREAILLTKYEGYSIAEAAGRAGVSETAMKTRVHRALRKVRRMLEERQP